MEPSPAPDPRHRHIDLATGLLVSAVAFVVYVLTLYRTVPGGDSGELIGAVVSGGVIHPPGYPLYSLLGLAFRHFPAGSFAFRLNLLSATCDAAAAFFLTHAVARHTRRAAAGLLTGALFAFAPGVWRYAIAAEVFALNNLVIAVLLWLAVRFEATRDRRDAMAGAFVVGLGLSNHQTVLFTAVPVIVWAIATGPRELRRARSVAGLVVAGALGLLPYAYLPIAASHHAFVSWGAADTWSGFWTHVLRREYGTFQLAPEGVGVEIASRDVFGAFWRHVRDQMAAPALMLSLAGIVAAFRAGWQDPRRLELTLLVPPLVSVVVMMGLGNLPIAQPLYREIVARFWQQPDLYLAVFAGGGLAALVSLAKERFPEVGGDLPAGLVAFVLSALQVGSHYRAEDHHQSHLVEDYGAEMLRAAPVHGLLVTKGDLVTNTLRYVELARHLRPDVRIVDQELIATAWGTPLFATQNPDIVFPGPRLSRDPSAGFQLRAFFEANRGSPIMVCGGLAPGDHTADGAYGLWPVGLCDDVHSGSAPVSIDEWLARSEEAVPRIDFTGQAHPPGSWEDIVWSDYWETRQARAAHLIEIVGKSASLRRYLDVAVGILQGIVDENPAVPAHVYRNLATAIGRAGITTPEQKEAAARAWEGYLRAAPRTDPQLPAIREEVARLRR